MSIPRRSPIMSSAVLSAVLLLAACTSGNGQHPDSGGLSGSGGGGPTGGATASGGTSGAGSGGTSGSANEGPDGRAPGQTTFTNFVIGSPEPRTRPSHIGDFASPERLSTGGVGGGQWPSRADDAPLPPEAPPVNDADAYQVVGTKLYWLNPYRGLLIYDITNPQQPVKLSRTAMGGQPTDLFVAGNVVHALVSGTIRWTQTTAALDLQKHEGSQLVSIDVTDATNPRVLGTVDIVGRLRDGAARKVGSAIYVVSEERELNFQYGSSSETRRRSWIQSFDVSNPANVRAVDTLEIFDHNLGVVVENGIVVRASTAGDSAIVATGTSLIVVDNTLAWDGDATCHFHRAVVSIFDVSSPAAAIRQRARFEVVGLADDPTKVALRTDAASGRDIFYGVLTGRGPGPCTGDQRHVVNKLETWDVTDGAPPRRLASLQLGALPPNDAPIVIGVPFPVAAAAFDFDRRVLFATVEDSDTTRRAPAGPLFVVDIADPANPRVDSETTPFGSPLKMLQSGGDKPFLVAIGPDYDAQCGFYSPSGIAVFTKVSVFDTRDLGQLQLVQQACITVPGVNSPWTLSYDWSIDRRPWAQQLLGLLEDGGLNLMTVPVLHEARERNAEAFWDQPETALGLLSWDLARHDASKPAAEQTIVQSHGTIRDLPGVVPRTAIFHHSVTGERTLLTLGSTHFSLVGLADLAAPRTDAIVEIAPSLDEVYAVRSHVVERVDHGSIGQPDVLAEFRVKAAGGPVDGRAHVSSFAVGQATAVYGHQQNLVVFRGSPQSTSGAGGGSGGGSASGVAGASGDHPVSPEVVVYDLGVPAAPRIAGRLPVSLRASASWANCELNGCRGTKFDIGWDAITTEVGLVALDIAYTSTGSSVLGVPSAVFVDLRDVHAPRLTTTPLGTPQPWADYILISDPTATNAFYLSQRALVETFMVGDLYYTRYRYSTQRWQIDGGLFVAGDAVNLPGWLERTWIAPSGTRTFVTSEPVDRSEPDALHQDTRINLLEQVGSTARLLASHVVRDAVPTSFQVEGRTLAVTTRILVPQTQTRSQIWTSDRVLIFDVGAGALTPLVDRATPTTAMRFLRLQQGKLLAMLPGEGLMVLDVSDASHARATNFLSTPARPLHVELVGSDVYAAGGAFGLLHVDLNAPRNIPVR